MATEYLQDTVKTNLSVDMFELVDSIRVLSFIYFIIFMQLISLGSNAWSSATSEDCEYAKQTFKCSFGRILVVFIMVLFAKSYTKECLNIIRSHNGDHTYHKPQGKFIRKISVAVCAFICVHLYLLKKVVDAL